MNELIAYAYDFLSYLALQSIFKDHHINKIMIYGSVARGDFDEESDVDLFFDVLNEKEITIIEKQLKVIEKKFYGSKVFGLWEKKGIENEIKVKVGVLDKWRLRRSVVSDGIVLYGKYKAEIKGEGFLMVVFEPVKDVTKRNRLIRRLFGRKESGYFKEGLVSELRGKRVSSTVFYVSLQFADKILEILKKEKVSYKLFEFWI